MSRTLKEIITDLKAQWPTVMSQIAIPYTSNKYLPDREKVILIQEATQKAVIASEISQDEASELLKQLDRDPLVLLPMLETVRLSPGRSGKVFKTAEPGDYDNNNPLALISKSARTRESKSGDFANALRAALRRTSLTESASDKLKDVNLGGQYGAQQTEQLDLMRESSLESTDEFLLSHPTETVSLIKARVGQSEWRNTVLGLWSGACAVTGLPLPELLISSHIKPWSSPEITDMERLDPENGLPLVPNLDKLFDRGFISFAANGQVLLSPKLDSNYWLSLCISQEARLRKVPSTRMASYLLYHRIHIFKSRKDTIDSNMTAQKNSAAEAENNASTDFENIKI